MAADRVGAANVSTDQPLLAIAGVSKYFGGVRAVEDVTVSIRRGEIMSVIGPNGAGKTSLLNMISGFYRPTSGTHRAGRSRHHTLRARRRSRPLASRAPSRTSRCSPA